MLPYVLALFVLWKLEVWNEQGQDCVSEHAGRTGESCQGSSGEEGDVQEQMDPRVANGGPGPLPGGADVIDKETAPTGSGSGQNKGAALNYSGARIAHIGNFVKSVPGGGS